MPERPRLLLNAFTELVPSHHHQGLWRTPFSRTRNSNDLATWTEIAAVAERGRFDGIFIADGLGLTAPFQGHHGRHAEGALQFPMNDAIVVASALAAVTTELSIGFTSSIIQNQPFELARLVSTLDHLSKGRVAWNVVTSGLENSYKNLGYESIPSREARYAGVDEFLEVVYGLWEGSWEEGAVRRDVESAIYADPSRIHRINHVGSRYRVQGPHTSEPSPQRTPFLYTAGMSASAIALAATHTEGMLIAANSPEHARLITTDIRRELVARGRRPDDLRVVQMMKFVVGSTHEEAERKYDELQEWIDPVGALVEAGGVRGLDLGLFDLDEEFDIREQPVFFDVYGRMVLASGSPITTIRRMAAAASAGAVVGTPDEIADLLETWQDAGVDGINVADAAFHGSYYDFVDHVVPVLQQRGLAQREYAPGTFREKVFGEGPHISPRHPAAGHRGRYHDPIGPASAPLPAGSEAPGYAGPGSEGP
jgi:FMN-dependent oxidoreductase (nitrilotriacetate monooxygenase family)